MMESAASEIVRIGRAADRVSVRPFAVADAAAWEEFVLRCPDATFFHRIGWRDIIEGVFRHRTHYLIAERPGAIAGILPLAEVRSRLFGHALVSLPFGVYGGPAATDAEAGRALVEAASDLADSLDVDHLELRSCAAKCPGWPQQDLYVRFRKTLHADPEANLLAVPRKQRAMIRKGMQQRAEERDRSIGRSLFRAVRGQRASPRHAAVREELFRPSAPKCSGDCCEMLHRDRRRRQAGLAAC